MRELEYCCQKMGGRMPGRPKQTRTTPISSVISSSGQIELFRLFKLFGWFSIHVPLNSVCHFFPSDTRNLGSQFPLQKSFAFAAHTGTLCSPKLKWLRISFLKAEKTYGWEYATSQPRSLLTRHLLQHFLLLDHGLLFANCFHKY